MPKVPWEWDETDLLGLISSQAQESLELEYKASGALDPANEKKSEISKDVSSFAHSAGGVIVYGIRESSGPPPRIPEALDGIDPSRFSREWLEQIITSWIRPRIEDVRIKAVDLTGAEAAETAYVLSIPQSNSIHQAADHKYYKRLNFMSVPMEHYEIMDVLNRATHPQVIAEVKGGNRQPAQGYDDQRRVIIHLKIQLVNSGDHVADRVSIQFWIPDGYNLRGQPDPLSQRGGTSTFRDGVEAREFLYYHRQQQQALFPLFPGTYQEVLDGNYAFISLYLVEPNEDNARTQFLSWKVHADNAPPSEGRIPMYELFFPTT